MQIIVFVLYKLEVPRVQGLLSSKGYEASAINSNFSQVGCAFFFVKKKRR